jgi:hypothetical protein
MGFWNWFSNIGKEKSLVLNDNARYVIDIENKLFEEIRKNINDDYFINETIKNMERVKILEVSVKEFAKEMLDREVDVKLLLRLIETEKQENK